MQRRLRRACTAVRERGASSYAWMAAAGGFGSVGVIVTKATSANDMPFHEKYVHELLKVFSISGQASLRRFTLSFTRRFGRTRSWRVALKCLLLLHRLLRSTPSTPEVNDHFRSELLWSRANGLITLRPCRFRDESSSSSGDYTAFVRSYSHFLDEALSCTATTLSFTHKNDNEQLGQAREDPKSLSEKTKEVGRVLELLPELQSLIDRVMECRPVGPAARSFVVKAAMKTLLRDSFGLYEASRREMVVVLDTLFQLPYSSCAKGFGVYKRASVQNDMLFEFYGRCKEMGLCGFYEYPFVERIPWVQIRALESLFNGMWQFSDDYSSSSSMEDIDDDIDDNKVVVFNGSKGNEEYFGQKRKFRSEEEEPLLIQSEVEDESWETLLDASVNMSPYCHGNGGRYNNNNNNNMNNNNNGYYCDQTTMVYNPNNDVNPFNQSRIMQGYNYTYFRGQ